MIIRNLTIIVSLFVGLSNLQAQEAISTTAGDAIGSGGSATYTVGQVFYTTKNGSGSVSEGVQQAYAISVLNGIREASGINLEVFVFPNPTSNFFTVKVENYEVKNLQYEFIDLNGIVLQTTKSKGKETTINIINFPSSTYYVKVLDGDTEIKVFKVIKN